MTLSRRSLHSHVIKHLYYSCIKLIVCRCSEGYFRCAYGACIPETLKCNRKPNCHDWSDEDETICGIVLPEGACRLPPTKPGTHYTVSNCEECRPGEVVPELTKLQYTCNEEGSLEGTSTTYCQTNRWVPHIPNCLTSKCLTISFVHVTWDVLKLI